MKRIVVIFAKFAISTLILWYVISKYGLDTFYQLFSDVDSIWVSSALIVLTLSNVLGATQWFLILRNLDIQIPYKKALSFYFTGLFFNNFLLSFVGGDAVRIYDITKSTGKNSEAVSTVFLDRLIGLITLIVFAFIAASFALGMADLKNVMYLILIFMSGVIFIVYFLYSKSFAKKFESFGKKIIPKQFHGYISDIYNSYSFYRKRPKLIFKLFGISIFVQMFRVFVHYLCARSLGVSVGIEYFFLFVPIIAIVILLPITVGGFGLREYSGSSLFALVGVAGSEAALFEFMAFVIMIISSFPGVLTFIFRGQNEKKE